MSEEISLSARVRRLHIIKRGRNISKADIYESEFSGKRAILKDYGARNRFIQKLIGRWLSKHEFMIYQDLNGVLGVPESFIMPDRYSFVIEYIDGTTLPETKPVLITKNAFDSLKSTIQAIHERGIACGDIHHRDILIAPDGKPHLIDFATGWKRGGKCNLIRNLIFRLLCSLDWFAFYRIRQRYIGIKPTADEKKDFSGIIVLYYPGRLVKMTFDLLRGKKK